MYYIVRALDCGSRGRRFETGLPPSKTPREIGGFIFYQKIYFYHYSQNLGSEDLIFTNSWLAEKGAPIAVLADKE